MNYIYTDTKEIQKLNIEERKEQILNHFEEAKRLCRNAIYSIENKFDPKHFFQIQDYLSIFMTEIEKRGIKNMISYFKDNPYPGDWDLYHKDQDLQLALDKFNYSGNTPLSALNTDIRVRRIPNKILLQYQNVFYHIYQIKELLGIKKNPKYHDENGRTIKSDNCWINFGYVCSEGERWGQQLLTNL